jgi:hypothetical protein
LGLCLPLENKTHVGLSDIVIQLIKAHSLNILFVVVFFNSKLKKKKTEVNGNKMIIFDKMLVSQG